MKKTKLTVIWLVILSVTVMLVLAGCKESEVPEPEQNNGVEDKAEPVPQPGDTEPPKDDGEGDSKGDITQSDDGESDKAPDEPDTPAPPDEGDKTTEPSGGEADSEPDYTEEKERIEELLDEVTELKSSYESQLSALEGQAANEYLALEESERTDDKKSEIALKYYNEALGLESQCDSQIDSICAELQLLAIKTGGDRSVATDVRNQYNSEKEALKSDYMSIYGDYLS